MQMTIFYSPWTKHFLWFPKFMSNHYDTKLVWLKLVERRYWATAWGTGYEYRLILDK